MIGYLKISHKLSVTVEWIEANELYYTFLNGLREEPFFITLINLNEWGLQSQPKKIPMCHNKTKDKKVEKSIIFHYPQKNNTEPKPSN